MTAPQARIVIADDAAFMRTVLRETLSREGFEVVAEGVDGLQAVSLYQSHKPDLIILDITMPNLDGRQALGQIVAADPQARCVMCSAVGQEKIIRETLLAGARDYLIKPFENSQVVATVRRALLERPDRPNSVLEELVAWYDLGELVTRHGLASATEIAAIRDIVKAGGGPKNLYAGLIDKGLATPEDLDGFLAEGHRDVSLAYFLLKGKLLSMEQLRCCLVMMRKSGKLLADTLVEQGFCVADQVGEIAKRVPPYQKPAPATSP
ncbi:MAG: response regulator [Candidatus Sericytochromatia bacterium]|nr:response regulator [Candidatus Tanganyikabacteria bacterium]